MTARKPILSMTDGLTPDALGRASITDPKGIVVAQLGVRTAGRHLSEPVSGR